MIHTEVQVTATMRACTKQLLDEIDHSHEAAGVHWVSVYGELAAG